MQMGTSYASAQMQAGPWGGTNGMIGFQSQQHVGYCSPAGYGQPVGQMSTNTFVVQGMDVDQEPMMGMPGLGTQPFGGGPQQWINHTGPMVMPVQYPQNLNHIQQQQHAGHTGVTGATEIQDNPFAVASAREAQDLSPEVPECAECKVVLAPLSKRCADCQKHLCKSCKEDCGCSGCKLGSRITTRCARCSTYIPPGQKCNLCHRRYCEDCKGNPVVACKCSPTEQKEVHHESQKVSPGRLAGVTPTVVLPTRDDAHATPNYADREKAAREVAKGILHNLHKQKLQIPADDDQSSSQGLPKDARGRGNDKPAGQDPRQDQYGYWLDARGLTVEGKGLERPREEWEAPNEESARSRARSAPPSPPRDVAREGEVPNLAPAPPMPFTFGDVEPPQIAEKAQDPKRGDYMPAEGWDAPLGNPEASRWQQGGRPSGPEGHTAARQYTADDGPTRRYEERKSSQRDGRQGAGRSPGGRADPWQGGEASPRHPGTETCVLTTQRRPR